MKTKKEIQQGDISFHLIDEVPANAKKIEHNGLFVVAHGEVSGHQHQLVGEGFDLFEDEKGFYLKVNNSDSCRIEHYNSITKEKAEHNTKTFEQSIYIKRHEERYNPFTKQLERTQD